MQTNGRRLTSEELGDVLAQAHLDAAEEVLAKRVLDVGGGVEVYYSGRTLFTRNRDFAARRKELEDAHQIHMARVPEANDPR